MYELVDFTNCPLSERHGSYTGNAGGKRGILYKGEPWIIKYPKSTKSMHGAKLPSYTSSPLSEFLGSQVYAILGIDVHETVLGTDGGKLVVACKDFRPDNGIVKEFRGMKNAMTPEMADLFDRDVATSVTGDRVDLDETLFHLRHNPQCQGREVRRRVFDMMVVDAIIDNNDRNNANWGFLMAGGKQALAPVFDNGNAFSNKTEDEFLETDQDAIAEKWAGGRSIYERGGHQLSNKSLFAQDLPGLEEAVKRNVTAYQLNSDRIVELIESLPETHGNLAVCSRMRKDA